MFIFQDFNVNKKNLKSLFVLTFFRIVNFLSHKNKFIRIINLPIRILYKLLVE